MPKDEIKASKRPALCEAKPPKDIKQNSRGELHPTK